MREIKNINNVVVGNNNKIKDSVIGSNNNVKNNSNIKKERWYSKLFWEIFIPVVVGVAIIAICFWLGLN